MTYAPRNSDNFCYRHPDRQSFVLCQRCGRTICGECQTLAAVGVQCPECIREARGNAPRIKPQSVTRMRSMLASGSGQPVVTYGIMALSLLGFLVAFIPGSVHLAFVPLEARADPWSIVTSIFLHSSILQLLFNMYSIFIFGRMLETQIGRVRFGALYLIGALGGEIAVALLAPDSLLVGGTAAIFGMFAAFFVIQRHLGNQAVQILVILALNIVIGLLVRAPWEAYVGAILMGGLAAYIMMQTRERSALNLQRILVIALAAVLAVGIFVLA